LNNKDLYGILGVSQQASDGEIKKAFKGKAKQFHPDISKEANAESKFKEVQDAYAILSDPQKKATYDQFGYDAASNNQAGGGGGGFHSEGDFSDIFSDIFSNFGGGGGNSRQQSYSSRRTGSDMQMAVSLTFKEAIFGIDKEFNIKVEEDCHECDGSGADSPSDVTTCQQCNGAGHVRVRQNSLFGAIMTEQICPTCRGKGKSITKKCHKCHGEGRGKYDKDLQITFPEGVDNGANMRIPGYGQGGVNGGSPGDLYIYVEVATDKFFKREALNIKITIPISYPNLVLGDKIEIPTVYGKVDLTVPKGTASHTTFRLKGQGIKNDRNQKGDQFVTVEVEVPKKLSADEKKIIKSLDNLQENRVDHPGFFSKISD